MLKTSNWEELLSLAGSRQVKYIGQLNGHPVYRSIYNVSGPEVVYIA